MAMAGQRQSRSGRRRNAARREGAAAASATGQRRSVRAQRQGAASDGSRQAQDGAARERCSLDMVTPAEIDRVLAAYQENAEPDVAARMDRKMAEEIIRNSNARIRESTNERINERIDYNSRVGIPRDLIRAYGLQLA